MIESLILVEGRGIDNNSLNISLMNAKHLVIGNAPSFGMILHLAATTSADHSKAMLDFSAIPGVTNVTTLSIKSRA